MPRAITYAWDGEHMIPLESFRARCDRDFVVGETYSLIEQEGASDETRNHYFACIRRAWDTLPEPLTLEYPTDDHLRKKALILTRHANVAQYPCASEAEALRQAAFYGELLEYSIIVPKGLVVTVFTAKSQTKKAMPGKGEFQQAKQDVLEFCASLIGMTADDLAKEAKSTSSPSIAPDSPRARDEEKVE